MTAHKAVTNLSEEEQMFKESVANFAENEVGPLVEEMDREQTMDKGLLDKCFEMGLMGIEVPEDFGGAGLDTVSYVLAMIEICAADASHGTIMSVNNSLFCNGILKYGSDEQKTRFVHPVASGEAIGAYALTEPQSGSDASNMKARAKLSDDGGHYIINAKKSWITSGPVARYIVLFAMTDPEAGARGVTAFVIDTEREGFHRGKTEPKLGIRASATCEIELTDYECPVDCRLGAEGEGFKIAMGVLDAGRIGIAAQAVGIARAAYEASLEYVRERKAFGREIGTFQMIQSKIADMKTRLEAATLLTLRAAWAKDQAKTSDRRFSLDGSMAKLYASEAAMWITHQAVQIHGGMGYSKEMAVERYFRDAKITEIYEGTSEIQRMVISRLETGLR